MKYYKALTADLPNETGIDKKNKIFTVISDRAGIRIRNSGSFDLVDENITIEQYRSRVYGRCMAARPATERDKE